ncbi:MAG: hypothetical protein LBB60_06465 [Desulfovibrio sp.]|jgi:hypothetical protein|nr:hypothetical protein [Desulfovibrio sp.]
MATARKHIYDPRRMTFFFDVMADHIERIRADNAQADKEEENRSARPQGKARPSSLFGFGQPKTEQLQQSENPRIIAGTVPDAPYQAVPVEPATLPASAQADPVEPATPPASVLIEDAQTREDDDPIIGEIFSVSNGTVSLLLEREGFRVRMYENLHLVHNAWVNSQRTSPSFDTWQQSWNYFKRTGLFRTVADSVAAKEKPADDIPPYTRLGFNSKGMAVYEMQDGSRMISRDPKIMQTVDGDKNSPENLYNKGKTQYLTTEEVRAFANRDAISVAKQDAHERALIPEGGEIPALSPGEVFTSLGMSYVGSDRWVMPDKTVSVYHSGTDTFNLDFYKDGKLVHGRVARSLKEAVEIIRGNNNEKGELTAEESATSPQRIDSTIRQETTLKTSQEVFHDRRTDKSAGYIPT